jgi:DNA-binding MarR family transcriptional regulator
MNKCICARVDVSMNRCLFELILAIKRKCQCNEEQIQRELGLSAAEFHGLMVLDEGRELLGGQFAEQMGLSPSRGSRVLNNLVENGFVKAALRPDDRRSISVRLTPEGTRMKARITEYMKACEDRICGQLDETRMRQVRGALELLETAL